VGGAAADPLAGLFTAVVARLDPAPRVAAAVAGEAAQRVRVVAIGKAAAGMARGAIGALGERIVGGVVVGTGDRRRATGDRRQATGRMRWVQGGHPVADGESERGGRMVLAEVGGDADLVLALISGGGSAMAAVPADGLSLADKNAAVAAVMAAGAPIGDINCVRKHLSAIKGGRLAAAAAAPVLTLVSSDVVGDDPATVASGPTVPDPTTFAGAGAAIERWVGRGGGPSAVRARLEAGRAGRIDETPKRARPGDRVHLIGGLGALTAAAAAEATARGWRVEELGADLAGDVSLVAERLAAVAGRLAGAGSPVCAVAAGEPTVRLPERPGPSGRAAQLALLVARAIAGLEVRVLCAGSDGIDGRSAAAGAIVDGGTWAACRAAGLDPEDALRRADAARVLAAAGAALVTGPTGVNHADLMVIAAGPGAASPG